MPSAWRATSSPPRNARGRARRPARVRPGRAHLPATGAERPPALDPGGLSGARLVGARPAPAQPQLSVRRNTPAPAGPARRLAQHGSRGGPVAGGSRLGSALGRGPDLRGRAGSGGYRAERRAFPPRSRAGRRGGLGSSDHRGQRRGDRGRGRHSAGAARARVGVRLFPRAGCPGPGDHVAGRPGPGHRRGLDRSGCDRRGARPARAPTPPRSRSRPGAGSWPGGVSDSARERADALAWSSRPRASARATTCSGYGSRAPATASRAPTPGCI